MLDSQGIPSVHLCVTTEAKMKCIAVLDSQDIPSVHWWNIEAKMKYSHISISTLKKVPYKQEVV